MKIYLAGPDVFRKDSREYGAKLKALCAEYGHEGLYPMDNVLPSHLTGNAAAEWIYRADLAQLDACDAVLANISPFRGPSCDVGTAVEIGYAKALKKPIFGYSSDRANYNTKVFDNAIDDGMVVEDFANTDNLMVTQSCQPIHRTFEDALAYLTVYFSHAIGKNND